MVATGGTTVVGASGGTFVGVGGVVFADEACVALAAGEEIGTLDVTEFEDAETTDKSDGLEGTTVVEIVFGLDVGVIWDELEGPDWAGGVETGGAIHFVQIVEVLVV